MAPAATTAARRAAAAPQARPGSRRPPLRIHQAEPRRTARRNPSHRFYIIVSVAMVVGSLLFVVVGDALVAQGQLRMTALGAKISVEEAKQKAMQTEVAQLAAPNRIVAQGMALGLTAPAEVVYLPQVPLDKPLATPQTGNAAPAPAPAAAPAPTPAPTKPAPAPAPAKSSTASNAKGAAK